MTLQFPERTKIEHAASVAFSGAKGEFELRNLPPGRYRLCGTLPDGDLVNPCAWERRGQAIDIHSGQMYSGAVLHLRQGYRMEVDVDDPDELISRHEGKTRGTALHIWVSRPNWPPMSAQVRQATTKKRTYAVVIPFEAVVNVHMRGDKLRVADKDGVISPQGRSTRLRVVKQEVRRGNAPARMNLQVQGLQ